MKVRRRTTRSASRRRAAPASPSASTSTSPRAPTPRRAAPALTHADTDGRADASLERPPACPPIPPTNADGRSGLPDRLGRAPGGDAEALGDEAPEEGARAADAGGHGARGGAGAAIEVEPVLPVEIRSLRCGELVFICLEDFLRAPFSAKPSPLAAPVLTGSSASPRWDCFCSSLP